MSLFKRIFKVGQAEAHSAMDKLEDPIKLTEQGIRDLKKDLDGSLQGLVIVWILLYQVTFVAPGFYQSDEAR